MLKRLCIIISLVTISSFSQAGNGAVKLSAKEFLRKTRSPQGRKSWAYMKGKASHRRNNKTSHADIYVAIKFGKATQGQVIINDKKRKESYNIIQFYTDSKNSTTINPGLNNPPQNKSICGNFGIHPQDLTMSFLFWEFSEEFPEDNFQGEECRVFLLKNPDKNADEKFAKVYITKKYLFPLKVIWYKDIKNAKGLVKNKSQSQYRVMEIESFSEKDDFWLVSQFYLSGPGWKTRIEFDDMKAGYPPEPVDLIKKI